MCVQFGFCTCVMCTVFVVQCMLVVFQHLILCICLCVCIHNVFVAVVIINNQVSCEGPLGKTSLKEAPPGPGAHFRKDELTPKVRLVRG